MPKTRLYNCWIDMKQRCYNPNQKNYHQYGAIGVTVCEEWKDNFKRFEQWAKENGYLDTLTLDRIDSYGNYSEDNCRWITIKEQQRNKKNNRYFTYNGKTQTISAWCEELDLNNSVVQSRLNRDGMDEMTALELKGKIKKKDVNYFTWNGEEKKWSEWCAITGEKLYNVHNRIKKCNWSIEEALGLVHRC